MTREVGHKFQRGGRVCHFLRFEMSESKLGSMQARGSNVGHIKDLESLTQSPGYVNHRLRYPLQNPALLHYRICCARAASKDMAGDLRVPPGQLIHSCRGALRTVPR